MKRITSLILAVSLAAVSSACGSRPTRTTQVAQGPAALVGQLSRPQAPVTTIGPTQVVSAVAGCPGVTQALQVLVLSADGTEVTLGAIQQALDYHGIPYTVWVASQHPGQLTANQLAIECAGAYQGVILATASLAYSPDGGVTWASALTPAEWQVLWDYEAGFGVRELAWYTYPGADQGLALVGAMDTSTTPLAATWTPAGASLFPYLVPTTPISISQAWTYLATPADPSVSVLLADSSGNALASIRTFADGRQVLSLTFDSNPYLRHSVLLAHGLVEWVTQGVHLGAYRAYLTPQIDDLLIDDDLYPAGTYRMTAADLNGAAAWLAAKQLEPGNAGLELSWGYNASGGDLLADPLTQAAVQNASKFTFVNHTFDHLNLDAATYDETLLQLSQNQAFAASAGFGSSVTDLITPDVSGLLNPEALRAASDFGVRWMVSDTSRPGWDNPRPNLGIQSALQPSIYFVPRRPTNLYYNVSTPDLWAAEYNSFYRSYWGRDLTYDEVLDKESEVLLQYMLRGEIDPHMYHQPNLSLYDGVHSLLSDLLDRAIQKFRSYSTLPLSSPSLATAGARMKALTTRNAAAFTAYRTPGVGVTVSSPVALDLSVTGPCTAASETYAGTCITGVTLGPGDEVILPGP